MAAQFNEWIKIFPNTEIKRAALYYFRDNMQKNEGCRVASVLAKSLSICKLAENYPKNINVDSNSIATFVSLIIILKYMFQQDSMDGRIKVIDSKLLNETLDFIFLKAELNYCLSVLSSSDEIICIDANIGKDALFTLIKRFRKLSIREQMTYSRFLLVMLFKYWKRTDAVSFNEYANAFVSNKNMSLMDVFDKFIDDDDTQSVVEFVNLFKDQIPIINQKLSELEPDQTNHKSVRIYNVNYAEVLRQGQ